MATEDVKETVEETVEEVKTEEPKWDAERQRADQAEANFRRAQQAKEDAERRIAEAESRAQEAAQKAQALQDKMIKYADDKNIDLNNLDKDLLGEQTVNLLKGMQSKIDAANERVEKLQGVADEYAKREEAKAKAEQEERAKLAVVLEVEREFDSSLRNKALALAAQKCKERGYEPTGELDAYRILRQSYQELSKTNKTTSKPVVTDTGGGSVPSAPKKETIKPGTLREVAEQIRKRDGIL